MKKILNSPIYFSRSFLLTQAMIVMMGSGCAQIIDRQTRSFAQQNQSEEPTPIPTEGTHCTYGLLSRFEPYTIYMNGSAELRNLDLVGSAAFRGNIYAERAVFGKGLSTNKDRADLISGRSLNFVSGSVPKGKINFNTTATINAAVKVFGAIEKRNDISWIDNEKSLYQLSKGLKSMKSNGETQKNCQGEGISKVCQIHFAGADPEMNIFDLKAVDLEKASIVSIDVPFAASVLINVTGKGLIVLSDLMTEYTSTVDVSKVLYHFADLSGIDLNGGKFQGAILAPKTDLSFNEVRLEGSVIGASLEAVCAKGAYNEVIGRKFEGCIPDWQQLVEKDKSTAFVRDFMSLTPDGA